MTGSLVRTSDGLIGKVVRCYEDGSRAQVEMRLSKQKKWLYPSEFTVITPVSPIKTKITKAEESRAMSKYCTDYEKHKDKLSLPFDPSRNSEVRVQFESRVLSEAVVVISSSPDSLEQVISELSAAGLENASDYVRVSKTSTHGGKYDLLIPDPQMPNVDFELGMYLNPFRLATTGRYEIGRKEYILSVISRVRVLEIDESIPVLA